MSVYEIYVDLYGYTNSIVITHLSMCQILLIASFQLHMSVCAFITHYTALSLCLFPYSQHW